MESSSSPERGGRPRRGFERAGSSALDMPSGPDGNMLDGETSWHIQSLGTPLPHVREFLAETEHQFLAETEHQFLAGTDYRVPDTEAPPGPGAGTVRGTSLTADRAASRLDGTGREERAAAGTVGIDPGRRGVQRRRQMTREQRIGGLLLAIACVVAAAWYVPRIVASDQRSLTGTVTSTGMIDLNFAKNGQLSQIKVRLGQQVTKGETLATESDPATEAVVKADQAAIAADLAKLAELKAQPVAGQTAALAAANAQLEKDQAQLDTDQASLLGDRIVAAQRGTVVGINGQPGEMVSTLGIRDYSSASGATAVGVAPQFSLLPEGPQSTLKATSSQSELPVVALRVSDSWVVVILVPESSVSTVRAGRGVTISVPAAGITGVRGEIEEVLPTPQSTATGVAYQAVVKVLGHQATAPLSGMSADVELDS